MGFLTINLNAESMTVEDGFEISPNLSTSVNKFTVYQFRSQQLTIYFVNKAASIIKLQYQIINIRSTMLLKINNFYPIDKHRLMLAYSVHQQKFRPAKHFAMRN